MSYLALYRKYRPSNFSDLVGQSEIVTIIKNEILHDKVSHAYLFSGPRGTGKTSTAKIIAKMINCSNLDKDGNPCGKCDSCLNFDSSNDVIEIDAASNNGVDEIRDLRDKVNLVPTYGRYKVYIIDEVHMLTTQAFNALLKTLEEPPSHIVFILATTEFYKIPITVVSRCQRFQFLKFSNDVIVERLKYICSVENITADDIVLNEISRLSDGGMRDAINMLDQLSSYGNSKILLDDVYKLNGVLSYSDFSKLFRYICLGDSFNIFNFVEDVDKNGKSLNRFVGDFLNFLKDLLIFKCCSDYHLNSVENNNLFNDLCNLIDVEHLYSMIISVNDLIVRLHNSSFLKILIVTDFIKISYDMASTNTSIKHDNDVKELVNYQIINENKTLKSKGRSDKNNNLFTTISDKDKAVRINNAFALASKDDKESFISKWSIVVDKVSSDKDYFSVTSMINDIDVMVVGGQYVIFVAKYDSLLERLFDYIVIIEKLLFEVYNIKYKIIFLANDEWNYEKKKYVEAFKVGMKYDLMDDSTDDALVSDTFSDQDDDIDKIVSILGNDVISYE